MSIYRYSDYLNFIKNEKKTLRFLADQAYIKKAFGSLATAADLCYYRLPADRYLRQTELQFGCNFDILIEEDIRRIAIEAKVCPDFRMVTYSLSMCELHCPPYTLIRKFHFDYAIPNKKEAPKPVYHIQYGGEATPQLKELNIDATALKTFISTPRISFYPVNLALLIDMIFNEFPSEETYGVVHRPEWRKFIKTNEEQLLMPYYLAMAHFFNGDHSAEYLLRDYYYGT